MFSIILLRKKGNHKMLRSSALLMAGLSAALLVGPSALVPSALAQTTTAASQTYVCPKCGRVHVRPASTTTRAAPTVQYATPTTSQTSSTPVVHTSYRPASVSAPSGGASSAFDMLNAQRARQGVPTLMYDSTLQAVAQQRAQKMASMGIKGHPPGSFAPGRYEGVGWSSTYSPRKVSACYTSDSRMRYAGAAMVRGRDGVYFAVVYR